MALRSIRAARRALLGTRRTGRERPEWRRPRPVAPPPCPPGWQTGPPDFIGVGSQKCGTSWWFSLLNHHPDVQQQEWKELRILIDFRGSLTSTHVAEYARWFPRPPGKKSGEWTPSYMTHPRLGSIIAGAAPDAKLLALVRDPVERYRSGLPQWRRYHTSTGDDEVAAEETAKRQAFSRGLYGRQLSELAESVGRERILVLQYERCARDPRAEFARTLEFLGLSPWGLLDDLLTWRETARSEKEPLAAEDRVRLVEQYTSDVRLLRRFAPDLDVSLWPNFADRTSLATEGGSQDPVLRSGEPI